MTFIEWNTSRNTINLKPFCRCFKQLWLVVQTWTLRHCVQHEQSFQSTCNIWSQKSNVNNPYETWTCLHIIWYHFKALFALVTIVWDPSWYDLDSVECITECIQFGRCFLGVFSFYAADVGRTKLKLMSLCSASRELLIDISFGSFWVKAIFYVIETWTSWIMLFWQLWWNQTHMQIDKFCSH